MKIVTGVGETPHVTSDEHRGLFGAILGQGTYILNYGDNLDVELVTNNLIKAKSGMMMHKTNVSYVKSYDEIELQNGTQGMKRIDLVVNRYEKIKETGVEKNTWVVIMGTPVAESPVAPSYIVGDLLNGDLIDDCPVYEVEFDGINVVEIRKLLTVVSSDISGLMETIKKLENDKQDEITGAATTVTDTDLTTDRVLISDANGKITVSSITSAVLAFLSGITSNIQTQLDAKLAKANVANNLTTTASGYALDARAGKTLNDKIAGKSNVLVTETFTASSNTSIAALGNATINIAVSKSGYTLLGVIGFSSSYADVTVAAIDVSQGTAVGIVLYNENSGGARAVKPTITCLFAKS